MHQDAFEEIKNRLLKPPILHMPENRGKFQLFLDTRNRATGLALLQIQNGAIKSIGMHV